MYCLNCGKQIDDRAAVCPYCGVTISDTRTATYNITNNNQCNGVAIAGFILAFVAPLIGFICSIVGISNAKNCNGSGKGLAIAGLLISGVTLAIYVAIFAIYFLLIISAIE